MSLLLSAHRGREGDFPPSFPRKSHREALLKPPVRKPARGSGERKCDGMAVSAVMCVVSVSLSYDLVGGRATPLEASLAT